MKIPVFLLLTFLIFNSHLYSQKNASDSDTLYRLLRSGGCNPGYILNSDATFCTGNMIELNSQNALTYQWSPADRFNNPAIQNPFVLIDSTRKYYLETTNYTNNLVVNPDFELGNTGFVTDYKSCDFHDCLWPLGNNGYSVGTDAEFFHSAFLGHDHTTGSGNFMIVNGAQPILTVWQQTIPVHPNTQYAFGVWISTMISLRTAQIQFSINGSQVGALYNAPVNANEWDQVFTTWNSGSATSATIKIVDILPILEGNDFGLDDLFFGELVSCSDSITLTASQNVYLGPDTVITPPDQVLELTSTVGPFDKYTWNTGEIMQAISISEPGKYWLTATDKNGCESADTINVKNSMTFVVFPNAFKPDAGGPNNFFHPTASNVSIFHMSVYNRWGQFMFETNDIESGWNGLFKGKKCPAGLYVYVADYEFQDDFEIKTSRGSFTLIR
jgi:gliding motility-associated-like protein